MIPAVRSTGLPERVARRIWQRLVALTVWQWMLIGLVAAYTAYFTKLTLDPPRPRVA